MRKIPREQLNLICEEVLLKMNEVVDTQTLAEQSQKIMNTPEDFFLFSTIIYANMQPTILEEEEEEEIRLKASMAFIIKVGIEAIKNKDIYSSYNRELEEIFKGDVDNISGSFKINFALNQFVGACSEYKRLNIKYPEIINTLK